VPDQKVRRPRAWRIHPVDVAEYTAKGEHCEARRCRKPVAIITWRWWRSTERAQVVFVEHLTCLEHGQQFAERHHIEVEPPPTSPMPKVRRVSR
jgi:hypothetical protein